MECIIRTYQPADRETLLQIGAETAFFGAPIEHYMEDRRIFMDCFYAYYTDYEAEHIWVACVDGRCVGFLCGCIDSKKYMQILRRKILPGAIKNWLQGKYRPGPKTWRYALAVMLAALRREIPPVDLNRFPAHLHINILSSWRGLGLGQQLIETYLLRLQQMRIPGVHLHTTSRNIAACALYEKMGFRLLNSSPTHMYAHLIESSVENRCYGLLLAKQEQ